jgi:hypothetical protein
LQILGLGLTIAKTLCVELVKTLGIEKPSPRPPNAAPSIKNIVAILRIADRWARFI